MVNVDRMPPTLQHLRRYAIARSLFKPTTLRRAIEKLGFVQADPIRAPARAQDLTLRHRVVGYRAGDLERRYPRLGLEEDYFVNYGYLLREHHRLMHPRTPPRAWSRTRAARAQELLAFIREQGTAHPRAVDRRFAHGKIQNWFGGATNATTRLLDEMHYRGLLRVARRDSGTRVYAPRLVDPESAAPDEVAAFDAAAVSARIDTLVDLIVRKYAPLPARSLTQLLRFLSGGVPQWSKHRSASLERASSASPAHASRASIGTGRPRRHPPHAAGASSPQSGCSRPSIRWSGTGSASSSFGAGSIASRRTPPRRSASSAITPCRSSGASG